MASIMDGENEPELPMMDFPVPATTFDAAAQAAGFTKLNAQTVTASAMIGDVLKKLGAVKIGRTRLLLADEHIDSFITRVEQLLDSADTTLDMKVEIIKLANTLIGRRIFAAKAMISSAQIDLSDGAKTTGTIPSFLPRSKVVPFDAAPLTVDVPPSSAPDAAGTTSEPQSTQ